MKLRISSSAARTAIGFFVGGGLLALGCSLAVDFDESKIPATDAAVTEKDSGSPPVDSGAETEDDTGPPPDTTPDDTGPPPDTTPTDTGSEGGDATDGDVAEGGDVADGEAGDATDAGEAGETSTDAADAADVSDAADASEVADAADASDTSDAPLGTAFSTILSGDQEVPAVTTTGTGTASLVLNLAETDLTYTITYTLKTGSTPSAAHFHTAFGAQSGGVTQAICSSAITCASPIVGTWAGMSAGQVADLKAGKIYINIHSSAEGGGELRGQLLRPGETLYTAVMKGSEVVPPPDAGVSSSSGAMSLILNVGKTAIVYNGAVTGFTPSGARIMNGAFGTAGSGPVYTLSVSLSGSQAVSAGDITNFDTSTDYVDVTSSAYPGGEVRGQIKKQFLAP